MTATRKPKAATFPVCAHRWRIDTPNGPSVAGRCKLCGAVREFPTAERWIATGKPVPVVLSPRKRSR